MDLSVLKQNSMLFQFFKYLTTFDNGITYNLPFVAPMGIPTVYNIFSNRSTLFDMSHFLGFNQTLQRNIIESLCLLLKMTVLCISFEIAPLFGIAFYVIKAARDFRCFEGFNNKF